MPYFEVNDLNVSYGSINAVKGISFHVEEGEIITLIGSNGAGKSTTLNTIAGLIKPKAGTITFNGRNITNLDSANLVKSGICLCPEGRQIFPMLTVTQNLDMGAYCVSAKEKKDGFELAYELFPILKERAGQMGASLSGGEQQMLAVARALMSNPKVIMFDEPSLGLAPIIVERIFSLIKDIRALGKTVILVEQNAKNALEISDRGYVLENGLIVLEGTGKDLSTNEKVKEAYLGGI